MKIISAENYKGMSLEAANIVINSILRNPSIVIGFATGSTPKGLYKNLVKANKEKKIDFSKIKAFNLDEYYPIKKGDKRSYNYYLFKNIFKKVNIKKRNITLLNGEAKNPEKECIDYENKLKKNPLDFIILGIGVNGHIAFNEPGSFPNSRTRLVELTHVRGNALTMGISTIMKAKKIMLLASGKIKANAVKCMIKGRISKKCPASFLRKHRNLIVIVDNNAGPLL